MRGKKRLAPTRWLSLSLPPSLPNPLLHAHTHRHSLTCVCARLYVRLVLPYEEHLRAGGGGAGFKIPESPAPPKPRAMRGRKPLPRGRRPGTKNKEKNTSAPSPSVSDTNDPLYISVLHTSCSFLFKKQNKTVCCDCRWCSKRFSHTQTRWCQKLTFYNLHSANTLF